MRTLSTIFFCLVCTYVFSQTSSVRHGVFTWDDLSVKTESDRETRSLMRGNSPHFEYLEIHATTQKKGAKPRLSKTKTDIEELIIVKEGKIRIRYGNQEKVLGPQSICLLLPQTDHQLENVGNSDATYYVMGYRSKKPIDLSRGLAAGPSFALNADSLEMKPSQRGGGRAYFDRPTAMCENFEMHVTRLDNKGLSHKGHTHVDTEIILVTDGEVGLEIEDQEYSGKKGDLFFIPSGMLHAVKNLSDQPCQYFAYKWR